MRFVVYRAGGAMSDPWQYCAIVDADGMGQLLARLAADPERDNIQCIATSMFHEDYQVGDYKAVRARVAKVEQLPLTEDAK